MKNAAWLRAALGALGLLAGSAAALPWSATIESQTVVRNIFSFPAASGGSYWFGAQLRASDRALVRVDLATGATSAVILGGDPDRVIAAADGGVFVAVGNDVLRVLRDGTVAWQSALGSHPSLASLVAIPGGDVLYVARDAVDSVAGSVKLARLRGADGSITWSRLVPVAGDECTRVDSVALLGGNRIALACDPFSDVVQPVRSFDASTGASLPGIELRIDGRPARATASVSDAGSDLFVVAADTQQQRQLQRLDASGAVRWSIPVTSGALKRVTPTLLQAEVDFEPAVVRASDGAVAWRPGSATLVPDGAGIVYRLQPQQSDTSLLTVSRVEPASGATIWSDPDPIRASSGYGAQEAADASGIAVAAFIGPRSVLNVYGWTPTGTRRAPIAPIVTSPTYAYVDLAGDAVVFARNAPDATASRTRVGLVDVATGATRWESTSDEQRDWNQIVVGACAGNEGTIVAASTSDSGSRFDPAGVARLAGFDRSSGAQRWRIDFGTASTSATLGQPFCDASGGVYVQVAEQPVFGDVDATVTLRAFDTATGALRWQRSYTSGESFSESAFGDQFARGPILSRRVSPSPWELVQLDPANGATRFATPLLDATELWTRIRLSDGDSIQLSQAGASTEMDLLVQRVDDAGGTLAWGRRLDGPYGARQFARGLSRGPADEVFVAGRNVEGPTWGRGSLALLASASGNVRWNVELPRRRVSFASPGNVRMSPDGGTAYVRQLVSPVFDIQKASRYELLTLDSATGALRHGRLLGPGSSSFDDIGAYTDEPAQIAIFPDGELLSRRLEGGIGVHDATVLRRETAASASVGNARVALRLGPTTGGSPQRATFRIEGSYEGTASVTGAVLRTLFPDDVVIATWQCRVEGGGNCGSSTRVRHVRQTVDLAPGARVIAEGTLEVPFAAAEDLVNFEAWLDLPFWVGDTNLLDNVAVVRPGATLDLVADQRFSGSWFNPQRSGEGWILEILPDGKALLFWFTYPPNGAAGDQQWLIAQDGEVQGSRIVFDEIYVTSGTRFGGAFNAADVRLSRWGEIRIDFDDCNSGRISYTGRSPFGSGGPRTISRLTSLAGVECGGASSPPGAIRSGAWYDPARAGEGWIVEALPDGRANVYWFTYSPDGNQAWTFGTGTLVGDRLRIDDMRRPRGTRFGTGFNAANVNVAPWGTLQLDFSGCNGGTLAYTSSEAGYDSASRNVTRLTRIAGTNCP